MTVIIETLFLKRGGVLCISQEMDYEKSSFKTAAHSACYHEQ